MSKENQKSFGAKLAALPMATKIISAICVVVIIAGAGTAALLLSEPTATGNNNGMGDVITSDVSSTTSVNDTDDDDVVVSKNETGESDEVTTTSSESNKETQTNSTVSTEKGDTNAVNSTGGATQQGGTTSKETGTAPTGNNQFYNPTNYADSLYSGGVNIKPRLVYWQDGRLYAECFVINGLNNRVWNIMVNNIQFYNKSVNIAQAGFGLMNANASFDGSIAPNSYVVWTFVFDKDTVINSNADLSFLGCKADVTYNH